MSKTHVKMTVNGKPVEALAEPRTLLIHFLREELNLTGPHIGCDTSHCGACTVDINGKSVKSCTVFVGQAQDSKIKPLKELPIPMALCMRYRRPFASTMVCNAAFARRA